MIMTRYDFIESKKTNTVPSKKRFERYITQHLIRETIIAIEKMYKEVTDSMYESTKEAKNFEGFRNISDDAKM